MTPQTEALIAESERLAARCARSIGSVPLERDMLALIYSITAALKEAEAKVEQLSVDAVYAASVEKERNTLRGDNAELMAKLREAERDAGRYRWLRDTPRIEREPEIYARANALGNGWVDQFVGERLDETIDNGIAAIARGKETGK